MQTEKVYANEYISKTSEVAFHTDYLGWNKPGNPDYINTLKNTFDSTAGYELRAAAKTLAAILKKDIAEIYAESDASELVVCVMPRAKTEDHYSDEQRVFKHTVKEVLQELNLTGLVDGSDYIQRHTNTRTTHLCNSSYAGSGDMPYPGITLDTCYLSTKVKGKHIVLVDDIYTPSVNVNEDAMQALLSRGAATVKLYTVAKTRKRYRAGF